jgi:hypothetical protein
MLKPVYYALCAVCIGLLAAYHVSDEVGAPKWVRLAFAYAVVGVLVLAVIASLRRSTPIPPEESKTDRRGPPRPD